MVMIFITNWLQNFKGSDFKNNIMVKNNSHEKDIETRKVGISLRDLYTVISYVPKIVGKAYITHLMSSGMTKAEALNLDVDSLVKACDHAFFDNEERTIEHLLNKNPDNIVPMWVIKTNHGKKITFSSSESLFYLFLHLKERYIENGLIKGDEKLFVTGNSVLSDKELADIFKHSDKRHITKYGFTSDAENIKNKSALNECNVVKTDKSNVYRLDFHFSSKELRNFFKTNCKLYLPNFEDDKKRKQLYNLFVDGISTTDDYYNELSNTMQLQKYYEYIHGNVTAKNYNLLTGLLSSNKFAKIFNNISSEPHNKKYDEDEIMQILYHYISYTNFDKNIDELVELAISENNSYYFSESKQYLDFLVECLDIKEIMSNYDFDSVYLRDALNRSLIEKIVDDLENDDIFDKLDISKDIFKANFIDYYKFKVKQFNNKTITKGEIVDLLIETIRSQCVEF